MANDVVVGSNDSNGSNLPMVPSLPAGLRSLLDSGKRAEIGDDGEVRVADDWQPPAIDDKQRAWISGNALPQLDELLAPADGVELTTRITTLLAHFYVANLPAKAHAVMIEDWRKALCDLPMWAIDAGCAKWFETEERKPTPAGIRRLAKLAVAEAEEDRQKLRKMVALPPPANDLMAALMGKFPQRVIDTWIKPLSLTIVGERAFVRCPGKFHRDWVRDRYRAAIAEALPGRKVFILADGEREPQEEQDEDQEAFLARMRRLRDGLGAAPATSSGVPLFPGEAMGAAEKERARAASLRRAGERA